MSEPVRARKHAPRGPVKAQDPMETSDPMAGRCKATNRQGTRCGRPRIPGGTVCRFHGGAAPQVQAKAQERLMRLQHPAIDRLEQLIGQTEFPTVAYAASRDVLDRTMGRPTESVAVAHSGGITIQHEMPE